MSTNHKNILLAIYDLAVINITLYIGLFLRFGITIPRQYSERLLSVCAIYSLCYMFSLIAFGMYKRIWVHVTISDMMIR